MGIEVVINSSNGRLQRPMSPGGFKAGACLGGKVEPQLQFRSRVEIKHENMGETTNGQLE